MRILSAAALAALDTGRFGARNGFTVEMPDGPFALWDDAFDQTIDGVTYTRGAGLFTIGAMSSAGDMAVRSVDITLSGIDPDIATRILLEDWHQRPVTVRRFLFATDLPQTIFARTWFTGFLDTLEWRETAGRDGQPGTSGLVARCEDIGRELGRKGARTRSSTDQRQLYADDAFFDGVVAATQAELTWGRTTSQQPAQQRRKFLGIF